jgi:hypothetical protein
MPYVRGPCLLLGRASSVTKIKIDNETRIWRTLGLAHDHRQNPSNVTCGSTPRGFNKIALQGEIWFLPSQFVAGTNRPATSYSTAVGYHFWVCLGVMSSPPLLVQNSTPRHAGMCTDNRTQTVSPA